MLDAIARKIKTSKNMISTFTPSGLVEYMRYGHGIPTKPAGNGLLRLTNGLVFRIRSGTLDAYIVLEVFGKKNYVREMGALKKSKVIVDIGANIGTFSIQAAKACPSANIYSFEPVVENCLLLSENLKLNNIENVKVIEKAMADKKGNRDFYVKLNQNSGRLSLLANEKASNFRKIEIKTIGISDFFEENSIEGIDFLKMDVEGAEYEILFSIPRQYTKRIGYVAMEWHTPSGSKFGEDDLIRFFEKNNFEVRSEKNYGSLSGMLFAANREYRT